MTWLRENVAEFGGDPDKIFVMGLSSGALHSATYVFMPDVLEPGTERPAGAILMSGPYTFDFDNPSAGELAYFGEDASRYPERVVVGNIRATEVPVLFMTAEFDIDRHALPFAALLHELISEHGVSPRYTQNLGHNHTSQMLGIGSFDKGASEQVVDFVERTLERIE